MKAIQTKTATAAAPAKAATPFFGKGAAAQDFFHSQTAEQPFFSKSSAPAGIQAKLTIGKPNDPYEREADAMADKVVQRMKEPGRVIQKAEETAISPIKPALQAKCNACEQEEKLQKKDENPEAPEKILKKEIAESRGEKNKPDKTEVSPGIMKKPAALASHFLIQAKCSECEQEEKLQKKKITEQAPEKLQPKALAEPKDSKKVQPKAEPILPVQAKTIVPVPAAVPAVQAKCASCEQEEKQQEGQEETDNALQKKAIFESNADKGEETIQRSCRECEEGDQVFLKASGIQLAAEPAADGSRDSIVARAKGEVGKVEAKQNDGAGKRIGSERLLEYFHIAAPGVWDDSIIETHGAQMPSWCGIFSVWAHKKAGKDIGTWQMGRGVSAFGTLTQTDNPQPGDIGYIDQPYQHHCIIERVDGDTIHSIDGNSGLYSEVKENQRPRSEYSGFFTAFGGAAPAAVQTKEEHAGGMVQTKAGGAVASPSVEQQLSSSRGKGQPLPESARSGMEQSFGADFSNVKLHTDSTAIQMSRDLHAQAFTQGSDIYFNSGKYDTSSSQGQHLLAHELTHVIQQGSAQAGTINRAASPAEMPASRDEEGREMTPENVEAAAREDLETLEREHADATEPGPEEVPEAAPDTAGGTDTAEPEEAAGETAEEEGDEEPVPESEPQPGEGNDAVPDNTPVDGNSANDCPKIVPEFPEPPSGPVREEEDTSFYEDLMEIASGSALGSIGSVVSRAIGAGAYAAWRALPLWVKIRVINFVLDRAISGAYMGTLLGPYAGMGAGWLSAAMKGFFQRLRAMPDQQKVVLFEKFGRIILKGDLRFTLGMFKGLLMGFFLDGLAGIVQMVIDLICMIPKILDFFRTIQNFLSQLPYEVALIRNSIEETMASVGEALSNAMTEIMDMLKNPQRVIGLINQIYQSGVQAAEGLGRSMADAFIRYAALPAAALGEIAGRIGGQLLFEAALAYITGGGGAAVTAAKAALRAIGKSMATVGRYIFTVVRSLGRVLRFIRNAINGMIRFLTPLLQQVARMARLLIDRVSALFRSFRRHCRPGSIICNLPRPRCRGRYVPRLGGWYRHDRYVTRTTGQNRDYRLRGTVFGAPLSCTYDAKMGRLLVEGKTGYWYLPTLQQTNPALYRMIMFRFNEQRWRCMAIAARCGYPYVWFMQNGPPAAFLNARWHGMPPVLHRP